MAGLAFAAAAAVAVTMAAALMAFIPDGHPPASGECVICRTAGYPLDPVYGGIPVCADVRACTRRQHEHLAADGKLGQE